MLSQSRSRLEKELQALEHEYRHELPKEIQRAKALGDLRENAEYQAALERQHYVQARIGHVQAQLRTLAMIVLDSLPRDRAALGSTVTVRDAVAGKEIVYELVIPEEADLSKGLISASSPIGRALVGKQAGDEVTVQIPAGQRVLEILKVITLHDKEVAE
ncbi:MAG TPA: transcription elongation factor GreA [Candidatus Polarisedimenticolia bacterium]|nr:transcription elongation factor GreA [Candidatus Polarisedimenticolia bacterium]